ASARAISGDPADLGLPELVPPGAEPGLCGRRVGQAPARRGVTLADLHRVAAEAIDHAKAEFVGDVVAEEYRHAARERFVTHEFLDCAALVEAGGLELEHHLAELDFERAAGAPRRFFDHR